MRLSCGKGSHLYNSNFLWLKDTDGSGPLAPLEHIDDQGNVRLEHAFTSDSYAHVFSDGRIMRYGDCIGTVDELMIEGQQTPT